jgi:hypothetical protein
MSTITDLVSIVQRLKHRVKGGALNFGTLQKLLSARVEAEEKFSQMLKASLSEALDRSDPLLLEVSEDARVESELHLRYASELRANVLGPLKAYGQAMLEREKRLLGQLKRDAEPLARAWDELERARRAADEAAAAVPKVAAAKREPLEKRAQKARDELQARAERADGAAQEFHAQAMPPLQAAFGEFDGTRLSTMQGAIRQFGRTRLLCARAQFDASAGLLEKMEAFDGRGRSARYLNRMLAARDGDADDAESPIAVAVADYRSDEPRDLQFHRGEQIRLASRHSCGWWIGEADGKKGFVPKTFLSIPEEAEAAAEEYDETFIVVRECPGGGAGALELLPGDLVLVASELEKRCKGTNLRTGKTGVFPLSAIDPSA